MTYTNTDLEAENAALRERVAELEAEKAPGSIEARIATAEAEGDWNTSINLKLGQLEASRSTEAPPADEAIAEAEEAGDYYRSGLLKVQQLRQQPASVAFDPEVDQAITAAEEAGDWSESLRLKVQQRGLPTI